MTRAPRTVWLALTLTAFALPHTAAQGNTGTSTAGTSAMGTATMDVALNAADMKWQPASPQLPAGTQMVVLQGDPSRAGSLATIRLRFPAGAMIQPHLHATDEALTVISGRFHVAFGDKLDRTGGTTLTAGGFTTLKAGRHHFAWVDGVTVVQLSGAGPLDIQYLNAADDPSHKK